MKIIDSTYLLDDDNILYVMACFYCKPSPFIELNNKVGFIFLFIFLSPSFFSQIKFSGKERTNLNLITLLAMTFGCQYFCRHPYLSITEQKKREMCHPEP